MHFLNTILDIVFPVNCVSCGKNGSDLCKNCLSSSPIAERECAEWIFPLFDYRHPPIRKAIHLLKYKNKKRLGNIFAESIYNKMIEELADLSVMQNFTNPILIPIPLSPSRMRERGYNQALLICNKLIELNNLRSTGAKALADRHSVDWTLEKNVLIKIKNTEHQARIKDRSKRIKNIVGTFSINNPEKIKGKNIILIDDVITTGATLSEARKVLKKAGAKRVIAFTVAH